MIFYKNIFKKFSLYLKKKDQQYKETVSKTNHSKNESIQLSYPAAIFIDEDKNICICDIEKNRTMTWESDENSK
jgi:3-isopropylmalate dehydratase small subunit